MDSRSTPSIDRFPYRIVRRIAVTSILTVALVVTFALTAWPQSRGTERVLTDPAQVKRIFAALDDGLWVPDGPAADTHVYVIYSTACGFSKKLFTDTRALENRPQFRWVTLGGEGHGAEGVVTNRTVESVADAFDGRHAAPRDAREATHAMNINQSLASVLPQPANLVYPMLIYKTAQGLRITYGAPANLRMLASAVQSRPDRASHQPASLGWLSKPPKIMPPNRLRQYSNSSTQPIPMRIAPYFDAPVLNEIPPGYVYQVNAVANGEWVRVVAMTFAKSEAYGYIHDPVLIKLANLEFSVTPASGLVRTGSHSMEIRSHPTMDSPVIEKLGPGFKIRKSGEVVFEGHNWTEVIVYNDGSKGYIAE